MTALPSIRRRLTRALLAWSIVWGVAVAAAVWLAVQHEVDELLDDTLQVSADVLGGLLVRTDATASPEASGDGSRHFSWQVVGPGAQLLQRSPTAPSEPLHAVPRPGFSHTRDWHVFGRPLGNDGRMLYVAQSSEERREAEAEVALSTALAAFAIGLLGHLWLQARLGHELMPLQRLSQRLSRHEPLLADATLGPAERAELQPVQAAIDDLARRLARRVQHERAFTAHAAHSLRTPLAGIDAQLAVALRECPPALQPRLQRVRDAAGRLQRVVAALLALFRSAAELQRRPVDVAALAAQLSPPDLMLEMQQPCRLDADADLLAAALLNLVDNALRYGAHRLVVSQPRPGCVRLHDDGPGVGAERRAQLQRSLDQQRYEGGTGLGLMLADLVARSHGGMLLLPAVDRGFAVDLVLAP
jgi:signal transduction histidine kinase